MSTEERIIEALRQIAPDLPERDLESVAAHLKTSLKLIYGDRASGDGSRPSTIREEAPASPDTVQALEGKSVQVGHAVISFGPTGDVQTGDIVGRDFITVTINVPPAKERESERLRSLRQITVVVSALVLGLLGVVAGVQALLGSGELGLWSFDRGLDGWRHEPADGRQVATDTRIFLREAGDGALEGLYDFRLVDMQSLATNDVPRATFFVDDVPVVDWSDYSQLVLEAMSPVDGLQVNITIFTVSDQGATLCWNELGVWLALEPNWKDYRFHLRESKYKTCQDHTDYIYPPLPFTEVGRLDIIVSPIARDPASWGELSGAVYIDNVRISKD